MTKKERAKFVKEELDKLYPSLPIFLHHTDAYTLLVAVALSAQTTDKKVNEITPKLFVKAGTPQAMAEMLLKDFNGVVPQTFEELEKLPGVGHKTASVVMSQAFGFPAFPVDTHIHRLMKLWKLTEGKNVVQTENDAKKLFAKKDWNKLHLQIIAYGREYSPARGWSLERDFITRMMFEKK